MQLKHLASLSSGYSDLLPPHVHSNDFSRGCRRVSPLHASLRAIPSQRGLAETYRRRRRRQRRWWHGFPAAGPGGCRGCNVVISDKRLPGDTHCAHCALAASTLHGFLRHGARVARCSRTRTQPTHHARVTSPLVTVHYVANRDISLGRHPSTSRLRVSRPNLSATHNRHS